MRMDCYLPIAYVSPMSRSSHRKGQSSTVWYSQMIPGFLIPFLINNYSLSILTVETLRPSSAVVGDFLDVSFAAEKLPFEMTKLLLLKRFVVFLLLLVVMVVVVVVVVLEWLEVVVVLALLMMLLLVVVWCFGVWCYYLVFGVGGVVYYCIIILCFFAFLGLPTSLDPPSEPLVYGMDE